MFRFYISFISDFDKSIYNQTVPTPESAMKSSPDAEETPQFTKEEVERVIKKMKNTNTVEYMELPVIL